MELHIVCLSRWLYRDDHVLVEDESKENQTHFTTLAPDKRHTMWWTLNKYIQST